MQHRPIAAVQRPHTAAYFDDRGAVVAGGELVLLA